MKLYAVMLIIDARHGHGPKFYHDRVQQIGA